MLCAVATLTTYQNKTGLIRGDETKLFVFFIKPHNAVTSSTIARWLKTTLEQSGIDVLKAANWSSESVFQKFYHKKVEKAAYGRTVE